MTKLNEIIDRVEGLKSNCGHDEHNVYNDVALLIRAVRQLGPYAIVAVQKNVAVGNTIDPDVLALLEEGETNNERIQREMQEDADQPNWS